VRPEGIIFPPPFFNQHLGLFQGIEDLTVEPFITEFAIEALDVTVFPRAARLNKERLNIKVFEPLANNSGRELGTVIRANMLRRAMLNKEIREATQDIIRLQASLNDNSQTLPTILINHRQYLNGPPIMGAVCHKVISPDMVPMGRPKTNTGAVMKPKTPSFHLLLGNFESLLPPDPLHPLVVDSKTLPL